MSKAINKYYISDNPNQKERIKHGLRMLELAGFFEVVERLAGRALEERWSPYELIERF